MKRHAFTLAESLIVAAALGVLTSLVVPQLAAAADHSTKSTLAQRLQRIDTQIAAYQHDHNGALPTTHHAHPLRRNGSHHGWGALVELNYLTHPPSNPYTTHGTIIRGNPTAVRNADANATNGWFYTPQRSSLRIDAAGYDRAHDTLQHER